MGKLVLFIFIIFFLNVIPAYSFNPDNYWQNDLVLLDKFKSKSDLSKKTTGIRNLNIFKYEHFLEDPKNLIRSEFKDRPYFKKSTRFWFNIYTSVKRHQVVIHDKENLSIIYGILDFSDLHTSILSNHTKYALQNKGVLKHIKSFKKT